ncbi:MAG: class I SAM-dependent methyltransferase [Nitrospirota bacterium]
MKKILRYLRQFTYNILDGLYLPHDKRNIYRTRNIRLIPAQGNRRGGKRSYAEWAHVIGIFQTLIYMHLDKKEGNKILDIGCGTGLLGIASEPFTGDGGSYTGMDVMAKDVNFCRTHYPSPPFEFIHLNIKNPKYAPDQEDKKLPWPLENESFNLALALSVWTHLGEEDAIFYMKEVCRVLKPGGKAIISFFLLDELYREGLGRRSKEPGKFHMTSQAKWIFDKPAYGSASWFCPKWVKHPEGATGVTTEGLERMLSEAKLELAAQYPGNWKETPGAFFQDVLVLRKPL